MIASSVKFLTQALKTFATHEFTLRNLELNFLFLQVSSHNYAKLLVQIELAINPDSFSEGQVDFHVDSLF